MAITPEEIRNTVKFGQTLRAETLLELADRLEALEKECAKPDPLSQALNEGDGSYKP